MKRLTTGTTEEPSSATLNVDTRLNDLAALRAIAVYLCEELTRLELDLSWSLAVLPEAIDREIEAARGRRSDN